MPRSGLGYAGMTPDQRGVLLDWLAEPARPIAVSYQDLYVAQLEVRLFEQTSSTARTVHGWLCQLQTADGWHASEALTRRFSWDFVSCTTGQDWPVGWPMRPSARALRRGSRLAGELETPLEPAQLGKLMVSWELAESTGGELLRSRLDSLHAALGVEPLAYVRSQWPAGDRSATSLALRAPGFAYCGAPTYSTSLAGAAVADVLRVAGSPVTPSVAESSGLRTVRVPAGRLFGTGFQQSRSEYFDYVLDVAQRLDGFSQLMDEDRHIIYRLTFQKDRMRNFWRIWDYVQNWNHTCVYLDGEEIEKWKIWPYSTYLR